MFIKSSGYHTGILFLYPIPLHVTNFVVVCLFWVERLGRGRVDWTYCGRVSVYQDFVQTMFGTTEPMMHLVTRECHAEEENKQTKQTNKQKQKQKFFCVCFYCAIFEAKVRTEIMKISFSLFLSSLPPPPPPPSIYLQN